MLDDDDSFGVRLREALASRPDISRGKLEQLAGLGDSYVSKLVQGLRPNPGYKTVLAIAQALGVEPLWLMTGEGEMGAHATPVEAPLVEDDDAETHAFLERLRSAVTQSGKTKLAIERDARVARGQLSHMLAARRPNVSAVVVVRLADAIGADVTWLLTGRGAVRPEAHRNLAHACALFVEDGQNNGRDGDLVRLAIAQVESNSDHPHDDLPIRGWFSMLEEAYVDACVQRRLAEELERLARRLGAKP